MTTLQQAEQIAPVGGWRVDPVHSTVGFAVEHLGVSLFRSQIVDFDATLEVDEAGAVLTGVGRVASIRTGDETLDAHLQSPEFFDAERHPEVRFSSARFTPKAGDLTIAGELTIRGATRPVELRGTISDTISDLGGNDRLGVELVATIDRTDFGIDWNAELPGGGVALASEVTLSAHVELVREA